MTFLLELLVVIALMVLNGVFAAAEIAVVAVRATRVAELARHGGRGADLARLRDDPERFLATVQIGITVVGAAAAAFGGATWAEDIATLLVQAGVPDAYGEHVAFVIVVVCVSYLSLVIGELVPKSLALRWAERYALLVARPLNLLGRIGAPAVWVLTTSSNLLLRAFGDKTSFVESAVSREELLGVIDRATHAGGVSRRAADIASRAIDLDELAVSSVMVPRSAIASVPVEATRDELARLLDTTDEDRFPVRRTDDDLIGYVTTRDVARLLGGRVEGPLSALVRPVHFVPGSALALRVLEQLQARRVPIAVIVDEAGGVDGVVDIEHLAEEIVGSLDAMPSDDSSIQREPDGWVLVPASLRVHVANRLLDLQLPTSPRRATLGGLVLDRLEVMPTAGARVVLPEVELEVVEASARRIHRIRIRSVPPANVAEPR